ncbi:MAG: Mur ligase family protein, partial [Solirubrobacteraceae bacterium]
MRDWSAERIAEAARAHLAAAPAAASGPERATIDSRSVGPGELFVGLPGSDRDGGAFAAQAIASGAWGALIAPLHEDAAISAAAGRASGAAVLVSEDPLRALQALASAWRREMRARVIGVTGSTGKTSTKELLRALLAPQLATVASTANFNTEIGLPLELLAAPQSTEALVLEMGMRGRGQIAELAAIAAPQIGVIVSVGPVHLELLGTVQAVAAAKAELIAALPAGGTAVVPAGERLLAAHLRSDVETVSFGPGGDVRLIDRRGASVTIDARGETIELEVGFHQAHLLIDLLAAVAAARAAGVTPSGPVPYEPGQGRGRRTTVAGGVTVIDDCYNA